jgi:hypothetical protein
MSSIRVPLHVEEAWLEVTSVAEELTGDSCMDLAQGTCRLLLKPLFTEMKSICAEFTVRVLTTRQEVNTTYVILFTH